MGHAEAQAEYDKLKGLVESFSAIGEIKDTLLEELDKAEAALKGVGPADALNNLELNLRGMRKSVLSLSNILSNISLTSVTE